MKLCIIGGSGFVGTYLVNALASQGHSIKVISRRPERHRHLRTLPKVKITTIDFFGSKILERQIDTYDVVINLAGILNPSGSNSFLNKASPIGERQILPAQTTRMLLILSYCFIFFKLFFKFYSHFLLLY